MKYIVGAVVVIIAAITAIVMLASRPNPSNTGTKPATVKLLDYADSGNSQVSFITQGRIVGDDEFRSIRIVVARDFRTIEVLKGYDGSVDKSAQFANTGAAYEVFLSALTHMNFTKTKKSATSDERGVCPAGNRFIYQLEEDQATVLRSWSANCNNGGSFAGLAPNVRQLFQAQIPGYNNFISGVKL